MKALERAARGLGIEGASTYVARVEIVEQRAGDHGLAHAAFVGAHQNNCGFTHGCPQIRRAS